MTAGAIRDYGLQRANVAFDTSDIRPERNDAHLAIHELDVLRADLDLVAAPEAAQSLEPLIQLYRGGLTSGDHLRLPLMTSHDGPALRAAVSRVIGTDNSAGGSRDDVMKEEKMRRVLRALDSAVSDIHRHANMSARY